MTYLQKLLNETVIWGGIPIKLGDAINEARRIAKTYGLTGIRLCRCTDWMTIELWKQAEKQLEHSTPAAP